MAKFLFVSDLDNTLVGNDQALEEINEKLKHHRQEYDTKIVYTTGRSLTLYQQLAEEKNLLTPDALVTAVGTEIYYQIGDSPDAIWSEQMAIGWERELVINTASHFADLTPQPETEQRPFKVSYFLSEVVAADVLFELEDLLQKRGLSVRLIYSGSKDLDIIPRRGNKGAAMQFLRQNWGIEATQTVVCGDSGNDIALFSVDKERGIIVGNALPELLRWCEINPAAHRYLAKSSYAAGILEGLYYFGFFK
ncbi:sucrose-phosphate phosphatase [Floridanema evergladense]|uniref:sucrose-phosphate phosphatase n=1 Tax=Floridaenema evergladense BLCC-F167 TaxID=3153639 RepID=A0ABV4WPR1_9CYAN